MNIAQKNNQLLSLLAYSKRIITQVPYYGLDGFRIIFKGFTPNKCILYDDILKNSHLFISDYERYIKTPYINYKYKNLFNDKLQNYFFLSRFTDKVCPVLNYIDYDNHSHFISKFDNVEKYVFKPNNGWGGKGIKIKISSDVDDNYRNYIVVPYIENHSYAKNIFPGSLNTLRLLTCVIDGEIYPIYCVHRFGTQNTRGVDNFTGGGISSLVDLNSGKITKAVRFMNHKKIKINLHPDTNQAIVGVQIPFWDAIKNEIYSLHHNMKFIKYIGWDIAVTPNSYSIIEANHVSDLDLLQCHGGILEDKISTDFYQSVLK